MANYINYDKLVDQLSEVQLFEVSDRRILNWFMNVLAAQPKIEIDDKKRSEDGD